MCDLNLIQSHYHEPNTGLQFAEYEKLTQPDQATELRNLLSTAIKVVTPRCLIFCRSLLADNIVINLNIKINMLNHHKTKLRCETILIPGIN